MDFWNRQKVRDLEKKEKILQDRVEKLEECIRGGRVRGGYCKNCANSFVIHKELIVDTFNCIPASYGCMLDCKCKDFKKEDKEEQT